MDVNIAVTQTGEPAPHRSTSCATPAEQSDDYAPQSVMAMTIHSLRHRHRTGSGSTGGRKTHPDMRRPPPGGRAGVVSTADSGGEESDRVSTVANDP